ncbi:MAG: hypothetical protein EB127_30005, partial [Alphaproteobacteria bacterium]|nr:hypothetical protein [Alphaproteobacteria bacterium]
MIMTDNKTHIWIYGAGGMGKETLWLASEISEYTIAGLDSVNNCPFIYRKGTLIAVCGRGGDSSSNGNGGAANAWSSGGCLWQIHRFSIHC